MPSVISTAITSEQWERVVQICQTQPNAAKSWTTRHGLFEGIKDSNVLPIHEALVAGAPYPIIEALIFAYPDGVYCKESSYQRFPLHCACRKNAQLDVVDLLLTRYADAALTADSLGRLPCKSSRLIRSFKKVVRLGGRSLPSGQTLQAPSLNHDFFRVQSVGRLHTMTCFLTFV